MSYILDALKKSEQERKKGQVPGLGTVQELPGPGGRFETATLIRIYILATILLVGALALGAWLFLRQPAPAPQETPPAATGQTVQPEKTSPPATTESTPSARPGQKTATAPPERPKAAARPKATPSATHKATPKPPPTAIITTGGIAPGAAETTATRGTRPAEPAPVIADTPPKTPRAVAAPDDLPTSEDTVGEEAEAEVKPEQLPTVPLDELPAETKEELPPVKIGVHLFSDTPASRRASINGRLMREGQQVDKDLILEEITRQGAILSFRGRKFSIPVFPR